MVLAIAQHVAALAESAQIPQPIVRWIAVHVCRRKHDACYPKPSRLHQVGPASRAAVAITPCRCLLVEPASVWQAAEAGKVWSTAALALSSGTLEANMTAQLLPVWGIQRSQFRADWHGYVPLFPSTR